MSPYRVDRYDSTDDTSNDDHQEPYVADQKVNGFPRNFLHQGVFLPFVAPYEKLDDMVRRAEDDQKHEHQDDEIAYCRGDGALFGGEEEEGEAEESIEREKEA